MLTGRVSSLSLVAASAVALLLPTPQAQAVCNLPAPAVVWSYPADGDTDVPTNAMIWVLTSRGRQPQKILLDGQVLDVSQRDFSFVPPAPMAPNAQHTVTINPPVGPLIKIRFTTGPGPAERIAPDKPIVHWVTPQASRTLTPKCQAILNSMGCFDAGEDTHLVIAVEGAPLMWLIERETLPGVPAELHPWPSECGLPEIFRPNLDGHLCGRRLRLHAVDPTGTRSMSAPFCLGRFLRSGAALPPGNPPSDPDAGAPAADGSAADAEYYPLFLSDPEGAPPARAAGPAGPGMTGRTAASGPACSLGHAGEASGLGTLLASLLAGVVARRRWRRPLCGPHRR
jgi:hypothetical protein